MAKVTDLPELLEPNGDEPVIIISGGRAKRTRFDSIAQPFVDAAQAARDKALNWADAAEDVPVEAGKFSARHWAAKALAVFNNGAGQVALAVSSAMAAANSAAAALASQVASATNAALALAAKTAAVGAAEASGNIKFFDTRATGANNADAALAGLPDQQVIRVWNDETKGGRQTVYRKEGGAYVYKPYASLPTWLWVYIDSKFGNDANDGLTADTPLKTLTAAITLVGGFSGLNAGRPYTVFALARGGVFLSPITNFSNVPWSRITSYGQGEEPLILMSTSPFTPGGWTAIDAETYYQDVDMLGPQGNAYQASGWAVQANMWHFGAWDMAVSANTALNGLETISRIETSYVQRVLNGDPIPDGNFNPDVPFTTSIAVASQAALTALVQGTRNTITAFPLNGDNGQNWEPRNGTASRMRIVWHTADGSNPNTNGRTLRITDYRSSFVLGRGMDIEGINFACNGNKDMLSGFQQILNNGDPGPADVSNIGSGEFRRVGFFEHAVHGPVVNGMSGRDIRARGSYMRTPYRFGGYTLHNFRSVGGDQASRGYGWVNVSAKRGGYLIGSHGNGSSGAVEHRKSDLTNAWVEDYSAIMVGGTTLQGAICENVNARDVESLGGVGNDMTYINSNIIMRPGVAVTLGAVSDGKRLRLIDSHVDASRSTGLTLPAGGSSGTVTVTVDKYALLDMVNSTVKGTIAAASALRSQTSIRLRKSSLGTFDNIVSANEVGILGTIDSDTVSVIECARTSPDTVRATFATLPAGVETGIRRQTWTRTLTASDFVFQALTAFNATTYVDNGDGTANVTTGFNYGSSNVSRYIKMAGANAGAADYLGRVVAWIDNSTIKVTPVPTGASSGTNKAVTFGLARPKVYRNPVTAWISTDGLTLLLADTGLEVQGITAGMVMNVSSPAPASVPAPGVREVQAVATTNVAFTGSITLTTLTVLGISSGAIVQGPILTGAAAGTRILSQLTSAEAQGQPGGLGTYLIDTSQTVASTAMTATPLVRLTLTKAIPWQQKTSATLNGYRSITTPTSGTGRTLKTVTISWGFQVQQRFLSGQTQPRVAVTFAEGGGFTVTQLTSGTSGQFGSILSGAFGLANLSFDANGSMGGLAYNVFDHEGGWWNQGFGLFPGDTLTLTSEHEILPWRLAHNSPVELAGYSPVTASLVAQRSIGFRPSRSV